jgi:YfiH family protein
MALPEKLTRIVDEHVLDLSQGDIRVLFAYGPPRSSHPPRERMEGILKSLQRELDAIRWCEQMHGRVVASLAGGPGHGLENVACVGRCDALLTADSRLGLVVWTADCVPILISGGGVVAAIHSGWRGAVADITGAVVHRYAIEYGVSPHDLEVYLGPAISGSRYEVGWEVIDSLRALEIDERRWRRERRVDLRDFLSARLEDLGLDPAAIRTVDSCTASTPELASHRRDGAIAGRQWSMIYRID